jgi:chitin disaccharide deacetylase
MRTSKRCHAKRQGAREGLSKEHTFMHPVVICADDFGISAGVSDAILDLVSLGRVTALSAIVTFEDWPDEAKKLITHKDVDIGLHLNFTAGSPLTDFPYTDRKGRFPSWRRLAWRAFMGKLDEQSVHMEMLAQVEHFVREVGHLPTHIDGHQHVHILPMFRSALNKVLSEIDPGRKIWVRDPSDTWSRLFSRSHRLKAIILKLLSLGFAKGLEKAGSKVNDGFSGFSNFEPDDSFRPVFLSSLKNLGPRHIVMVHPGKNNDFTLPERDRVIGSRVQEYAYLKSLRCLDDFVVCAVCPTRLEKI